MNLLDLLHRNAQMYPDLTIWEDALYGDYTFGYIEDSASRIYFYLSKQNIGTEDIVAIQMKRSARIFLVMLAVWKAGAAFVVIGENSPEDYIYKMLKDANPKLVFDDFCFDEALLCPQKEDYHNVDPHDLACVVYSTGSSGMLKGSMHEYGAIQKRLERAYYCYSYSCSLVNLNKRISILFSAGFYSIVAVTALISNICYGESVYIASQDEIVNVTEQVKILQEKNINRITISPSAFEKLKTYDLPDLKYIEMTYDINKPIRDDRYIFVSPYGLTEGFGALTTITHGHEVYSFLVGKPHVFKIVSIENEQGNEVTMEELGEICFKPEYFRGYLNQPELTKKVYYNGWFHTGDMGYIDSDGNYNVVGRKIDMLKIEQGYIVPAIISNEISKRFSGVTKNYVKLFGDANQYKVVVYYVSDTTYKACDFARGLEECFPRYMLPTHAVKVDDFTYFPSGKINRLAFSEPQ